MTRIHPRTHSFTVDVLTRFIQNYDGSWTCVMPTRLAGPQGAVDVQPRTTFRAGEDHMGLDIAGELDRLSARSRPEAVAQAR